jgi:hypothetical protein
VDQLACGPERPLAAMAKNRNTVEVFSSSDRADREATKVHSSDETADSETGAERDQDQRVVVPQHAGEENLGDSDP